MVGTMIAPAILQRADTAVSVNIHHWQRDRAAEFVEAAGGSRLPLSGRLVFAFIARAPRDAALDLARRKFGWTVATPVDARLRLSADPRD
jgi:hypothetical protein